MEEKTLCVSKHGKIALVLSIIIIIIGIIILLVFLHLDGGLSKLSEWDYFELKWILVWSIFTFFPALVVALIIYFSTLSCSMTITDKRVYGKATFGKRVDIPLDSISAVGTSALKGISVASSSGKIQFYDFSNRDELHEIISNLLMKRQEDKKAQVPQIRQNVSQSNADELKKFKELFDQGIITQEEFEAKKKQLLGL